MNLIQRKLQIERRKAKIRAINELVFTALYYVAVWSVYMALMRWMLKL